MNRLQHVAHAGVSGFLLKERQKYHSPTTVGSTATQAFAQLLKNNYGSIDIKKTNPTALDSHSNAAWASKPKSGTMLATVTP